MDLYDGSRQALSYVSAQAADIYQATHSVLFTNGGQLLALASVGVICGAIYFDRRRNKRLELIERGLKMTKRQRQRYLDVLLSDGLVNMLEDMEMKNEITPSEKANVYRKLGLKLDIRAEVTNRKLTAPETESLMETIKRRYHHLIKAKAPEIPGPKPGEDLVVAKPKPTFGSTFLNRIKAA